MDTGDYQSTPTHEFLWLTPWLRVLGVPIRITTNVLSQFRCRLGTSTPSLESNRSGKGRTIQPMEDPFHRVLLRQQGSIRVLRVDNTSVPDNARITLSILCSERRTRSTRPLFLHSRESVLLFLEGLLHLLIIGCLWVPESMLNTQKLSHRAEIRDSSIISTFVRRLDF